MANSATNSGVQIKYIQTQTASPTAKLQPTVENSQNNLLSPQNELQQEVMVTPTILVTPTASNAASLPIQYDFFNVRVFGVLIGLIFLWIYVKGLKKKKD